MSTIPNPALIPPGTSPAAPTGTPAPAPAPQQPGSGSTSFAEVLARSAGAPGALTFSRHALERLNRRGIQVDSSTLSRLEGGAARAAAKGSRDAVVFVDKTAFVVSVQNKTVITAVGAEHMREHVFTNIDSAVIA